MADFNSRIGRTIKRRLRQENIIWLTTVDLHSTPQPRPVWFHWDGQTVLIFSQPTAAKVRHIAHNARVALNFNTDAEGCAMTLEQAVQLVLSYENDLSPFNRDRHPA